MELQYRNTTHAQGVVPKRGTDGRWHYIYKLIDKRNNKIYIGRHTARMRYNDCPLHEPYRGSGIIIRELTKGQQYYQNFDRVILEYCDTQQQLIDREKYYVDRLFENYTPDQYYNVGEGGIGFDKTAWKHSKETNRKPVLNVFDFTSPINNRFFKAGTIFDSMVDAGRQIGFKSIPTFNCNIMLHPDHPGIWVDRKQRYKMISCFVMIEKDQAITQELIEYWQRYYLPKVDAFQKQHWENVNNVLANAHKKAHQTNRKRIRVCANFVSPKNNRFFEAGTIFNSVGETAKAIGINQNSFTMHVISNKKHPMEWWSRFAGKYQLIVKFEFV